MSDLTISEIIDDPLIHVMLNADGISPNAFAQFLESAARVHARGKETRRDRVPNRRDLQAHL